jgi:hypothetical protein
MYSVETMCWAPLSTTRRTRSRSRRSPRSSNSDVFGEGQGMASGQIRQ